VLAATTTAMGQKLDDVRASASALLEDTLVVGTDQGAVLGYNTADQSRRFAFQGIAKVRTLKAGSGYVYWLSESARYIQFANLSTGKVNMVPVPMDVVPGELQRLSLWQGGVMIHGANRFTFFNPVTEKFSVPQFSLNSEVWKVARQGMVDSYWSGDSGMFVAVRRFGPRSSRVEAGETTEMAMMTAWSSDASGNFQLLGHYACPLVKFETASGPEVLVRHGVKTAKYQYGSGPLGNLKLTGVGMVALTDREIKVAPFSHENWMPNSMKPAFAPGRAQAMDANRADVWWTDGRRAYRASVEDGTTTAYDFAGAGTRIQSLVADEEGAWALTDQGVRRLIPGGSDKELPSLTFAADDRESETIEQSKVAEALVKVQGKSFGTDESMGSSVFNAAGIKMLASWEEEQTDEIAYGDVIKSRGQMYVYVGGNRVLAVDSGIAGVRAFSFDPEAKAYRVMSHTPMPEAPARYIDRTKPTVKPRPMAPVNANPYLRPRDMSWGRVIEPLRGTLGGIFKVVVGAAFDKPHKTKHQQLLDEAMSWIGTRYVWAGNTKSGVDCSGFIKAIYKSVGIQLPRHSQAIGRAPIGKVVKGELHFGDVLVIRKPNNHVMMYIGDGKMIHATPPRVQIDSVYKYREVVVRRFIE
jgi:cell wall-associated NlpC family hydrolase